MPSKNVFEIYFKTILRNHYDYDIKIYQVLLVPAKLAHGSLKVK